MGHVIDTVTHAGDLKHRPHARAQLGLRNACLWRTRNTASGMHASGACKTQPQECMPLAHAKHSLRNACLTQECLPHAGRQTCMYVDV